MVVRQGCDFGPLSACVKPTFAINELESLTDLVFETSSMGDGQSQTVQRCKNGHSRG